MKFVIKLFLVCIVIVNAQAKAVKYEDVSDVTHTSQRATEMFIPTVTSLPMYSTYIVSTTDAYYTAPVVDVDSDSDSSPDSELFPMKVDEIEDNLRWGVGPNFDGLENKLNDIATNVREINKKMPKAN